MMASTTVRQQPQSHPQPSQEDGKKKEGKLQSVRVTSVPSSLAEVLADAKLKKRFAEHLQSKLCVENIQFWDEVEEYKKNPQQATAERIFELYFYGGQREINVDAEDADTIRNDMRKKNFHSKLFNEAQKFVFELMEQSVFPQFKALIEQEVKMSSKEEASKTKIKKKTSISLENIVIVGPQRQLSNDILGVVVSGWFCTMKQYDFQASDKEDINRELKVIRKLPFHPNIVPTLLHDFPTPTRVRVFMGWAEESLQHCIRRKGIPKPTDDTEILIGIIKGLQFLHENKIMHRNLSTESVFLQWGATGVIACIGNFDSSKKISSKAHAKTVIGNYAYMAPEVVTSEFAYDFSADVYSFGMVIYAIMTKSEPWSNTPAAMIPLQLAAGKRPEVPKDVAATHDKLNQLYLKCTSCHIVNRPTLAQIKMCLLSNNQIDDIMFR